MDYNGNNSPFFSVVVPVYNKAPHIKRSIYSVVRQSFTDFELILINDASTDSSQDEILKFSDPRIRLFDRQVPGAGGYAARNLGIARSRADWVAFLDADDEWHSDHLKHAVAGISAYPDAGVISSGWVTSLGHATYYDGYYKANRDKGQHLYDAETFMAGPRPIWTSVAVVKKNILNAVGGFDERWPHGADTDLWLRILLFENTPGLWLAELGATYHMDAVNRVSADIFQTFSPIAETAKKYLNNNPHASEKLKKALMRYANTMSLKPLLRKMMSADFGIQDISGMLFWGSLPLRTKVILMSLVCLSDGLRTKAASKILEKGSLA
jgi:glycosyltransferase involved in cell wall biosynthesis